MYDSSSAYSYISIKIHYYQGQGVPEKRYVYLPKTNAVKQQTRIYTTVSSLGIESSLFINVPNSYCV